MSDVRADQWFAFLHVQHGFALHFNGELFLNLKEPTTAKKKEATCKEIKVDKVQCQTGAVDGCWRQSMFEPTANLPEFWIQNQGERH